LESIVFGRLVAEAINARRSEPQPEPSEAVLKKYLQRTHARVERIVGRTEGVGHHAIAEKLKTVLTEKVGLFRNEADLAEAVAQIGQLRQQYQAVRCQTPLGPFSSEIVHVLELESLLYLGEITARGALARRESRGSHFRTDYPQRNDGDWLRHTLARRDGDEVRLSSAAVDVSLYAPQARTY
jgi:succinate dehydrogenase / fumarate reductase, flavoprotein subunit